MMMNKKRRALRAVVLTAHAVLATNSAMATGPDAPNEGDLEDRAREWFQKDAARYYWAGTDAEWEAYLAACWATFELVEADSEAAGFGRWG